MARRPGAGWPSAEGAQVRGQVCGRDDAARARGGARAGSAPLASATQAAFLADSSSRAEDNAAARNTSHNCISLRGVVSRGNTSSVPCAIIFSLFSPPDSTRTDGASNRHAHQAACNSPRAFMRFNLRFKWPKRVTPPARTRQTLRRTWRMACSSSCSTRARAAGCTHTTPATRAARSSSR